MTFEIAHGPSFASRAPPSAPRQASPPSPGARDGLRKGPELADSFDTSPERLWDVFTAHPLPELWHTPDLRLDDVSYDACPGTPGEAGGLQLGAELTYSVRPFPFLPFLRQHFTARVTELDGDEGRLELTYVKGQAKGWQVFDIEQAPREKGRAIVEHHSRFGGWLGLRLVYPSVHRRIVKGVYENLHALVDQQAGRYAAGTHESPAAVVKSQA